MLRDIKHVISTFLRINVATAKQFSVQHSAGSLLDATAAELIRNTHSIEKGLSISAPRPGFGHAKHKQMMQQILALENSTSSYHKEACQMAVEALQEYIDYHNTLGYIDAVNDEMAAFLQEHKDYFDTDGKKFGGTLTVHRDEMNIDLQTVEEFLDTRHSIRDFAGGNIEDDKLLGAVKLAQRAPSACNRQAVRVYIIGTESRKIITEQLKGIGGFADAVGKYLLITAKTSSYNAFLGEEYQYIVSASIFAAYLALTVHAYGYGACLVQRSIVWSPKWQKVKKQLHIPDDEQCICLLGVGNLKESCKVPVSHRLENDEMIQWRA